MTRRPTSPSHKYRCAAVESTVKQGVFSRQYCQHCCAIITLHLLDERKIDSVYLEAKGFRVDEPVKVASERRKYRLLKTACLAAKSQK